ncbi:isocitrate/isopropylmalate dehydrogenase family protein [Armatimonas sp.]|uniref:isocitrate/isopropylmalate dehydrogenase family protein n=1 Tax=Armatimonas sp. TaxID=1872638 RepID=UPI00374DC8F6
MMKQREFQIVVLPGDGIGPEVMTEGGKVLDAARALMPSCRFTLTEYPAGAGAYVTHGDPLPDTTFSACERADAILLGAMGLPGVRWPDGREMTPQIDLRERLDLYAGIRPILLFHPSHTPLKNLEALDMLLVRENCEGLFWSRKNVPAVGAKLVDDVLHVSRRGAERVCRAAFREAQRRRNHVTLVDKANVLPSMVFLRQIFDEVALEFPEVKTDRVYVDAMALYLVQKPERFDVLVTENMFGDILSDLAAGLIGGMGMAPSADIGDKHAVFQPSHGTAPDIAGKGIANPTAMILSVALMLEWLGHAETVAAAEEIRRAVSTVLGDPVNRTADLGGTLSTTALGDAIAARI